MLYPHLQWSMVNTVTFNFCIGSSEFRVGESDGSDKDLENSYRPMYPMYTNSQYPLACTITVEAGEVKPIR